MKPAISSLRSSLQSSLRIWARRLKRYITALWIAARDPRTPAAARFLALAVAAYALSPVDLIPDFIPVLGYLDDLLLLPLGIALVIKLIPRPLMQEFLAEAEQITTRPVSYTAAFIIVLVWVSTALALVLIYR